MITLTDIENLVSKFSSLDSDFLTSKELDRATKFIDDLYRYEKEKRERHVLREYNGFKQYVDAMNKKIIARENIPFWYAQNKV